MSLGHSNRASHEIRGADQGSPPPTWSKATGGVRRRPRRPAGRGRVRIGDIVAVGAACLLIIGCTLERRHAVLTFFFNDVPPLGGGNSVTAVDSAPTGSAKDGKPAALPLIPHSPYAKKECDRCHPKNVLLIIGKGRQPGFCFQCHEHEAHKTLFASYTYLHGPVVVEGCLDCHNPHSSKYPGLALDPDPALCYRCHVRDVMLELPGHRGWPGGTCLRCHDPHGGNERYFLRAGNEP